MSLIEKRKEIESGKYKVFTNHGEPAEIVKWNCRGKYPILAVMYDGDTDDCAFYDAEGKGICDGSYLVLKDADKVWSDYEKAFDKIAMEYSVDKRHANDCVKEYSLRLLPFALEAGLGDIDYDHHLKGLEYELDEFLVNSLRLVIKDKTPHSIWQIIHSYSERIRSIVRDEMKIRSPQFVPSYGFTCPISGGMCTNQFHDCINCPWHNVTIGYTTTTSVGDGKK